MPYQSLGEFIKAADRVGEVRYVEGADLDLDVGCLTELMAERNGPMLVFDKFSAYPPGYRICSNFVRSVRRFALAMDLPLDVHPLEILRAWREKRKASAPIPAAVVRDGPIMECVQQDGEVNVERFPAPRWHTGDGGRYIGTADMVITRDPDENWINAGIYRAMIQRPDRISLWINPMKHGRIIVERYWREGNAAPVAVVLGCEPVTWLTASMSPPFGASEYELAGAYRGSPVEVVRLPLTGLPVPSGAEIVLEGFIPPTSEEAAHEGPFGEWPGYYTHEGDECVVRIQRIYHRREPILAGAPPLRPIGWSNITTYVQVWEHLERSGVTDVTGVWGFNNGLLTVVALRQRYAGHAKQALISAAGFRHGDMKCYYVTVDDDVDPTNLEEVLWAMCTRVDPATAVDIIHDAWTADLDPRLSPAKRRAGELTVGRMLINACRPYSWRDQFPKTNVFTPAERRRVQAKWRDFLENVEAKRELSSAKAV
ncbi:MAG: UbiD family decarboxylase [Deltaproteobacteria bacterium]|nr:MAG: UbiD family decarboxylase [Deltaproteobacteria bacterium]